MYRRGKDGVYRIVDEQPYRYMLETLRDLSNAITTLNRLIEVSYVGLCEQLIDSNNMPTELYDPLTTTPDHVDDPLIKKVEDDHDRDEFGV